MPGPALDLVSSSSFVAPARSRRANSQCLNLANGMMDIHTPDERIAVADLEAMVDVTLALVDAALA